MPKGKKRKRFVPHRPVPLKLVPIPTTNEPISLDLATRSPSEDLSSDTQSFPFLKPGGTDVPPIGIDEPTDKPATTNVELFEKLLFNRQQLDKRVLLVALIIAWFAVCSYMFVQDNAAGKLENVAGLESALRTIGIYSLFFAFVAGLIMLIYPKK